ncbi:MAG: hypothetical protein ACOC05_01085 [Oceanicaulis sp.]
MSPHLHLSTAAAVLLLAACNPASQAPEAEDRSASAAQTSETPSGAEGAGQEVNPLLAEWTTPFGAPPFGEIEPGHFIPAFETAMASHNAEIEAIATNPDAPTFENTLLAMETAGEDLGRVSRVFFNLTSSASSDEIRAIQREMSPRLAAHSAAITLNEDLFARIDALFEQRDTLDLTDQQARLLEVTHQNFVRAGAKL